MSKPYLIADIGGTNARFCLARLDESEDGVAISDRHDYKSSDYDRLEDALNDYLGTIGEADIHEACFAVAGPIKNRVVDFTNSAWMLDGNKMEKGLGLDNLLVVNDFRAMTYGSLFVPADEMIEIKPGFHDPLRPRAVLGPGTGLGLGLVVPCGERYRAIATEGGHVTFSPATDRQNALLKNLSGMFGHVSFERIVSGKGILNTYRALCSIDGVSPDFSTPEDITRAALEHNDPKAEETLTIFCEALGTYAGNIVLSTGARGGVYLAGGILPKILDFFTASRFTHFFHEKQPMESYMDDVPIKLITSKNTALIGAARLLKDGL